MPPKSVNSSTAQPGGLPSRALASSAEPRSNAAPARHAPFAIARPALVLDGREEARVDDDQGHQVGSSRKLRIDDSMLRRKLGAQARRWRRRADRRHEYRAWRLAPRSPAARPELRFRPGRGGSHPVHSGARASRHRGSADRESPRGCTARPMLAAIGFQQSARLANQGYEERCSSGGDNPGRHPTCRCAWLYSAPCGLRKRTFESDLGRQLSMTARTGHG